MAEPERPTIAMPEIRITRITDTYLQDFQDEEAAAAKPPKMSKKEKKAIKKEAKRLRKLEEDKLVMRHGLKVELELGKRMEIKGMEEWSEMISQIKIVELREEMESWGQRAKQIIDNKNDRIHMLIDDMEQTQDQHSRSFGKTVELIDHIGDCYHAMLESGKRMYEQQAEQLLKEFYDEVHFRTEEVEAMHTNCDNVIHASNLLVRDQLQLDYQIYLDQRDNCVNQQIENRFHIRSQVVDKMTEMQHQLNDFVESLHSTDLDAHKYERIRSLTERQQAFLEESKKLNVEEMKYISMLKDIQRDILRVETEDTTTLNDLRLEFEYFANVRKKIEERMHADRITTHEKLRILSTACYELTKKFEKINKSGELLLALSITCRKLQTESEKIIVGGEMFDQVDVGKCDENLTLQTLDIKQHVDLTEEELVMLNNSLKNFWRQQGMAQAQNMLLLEEKHRLTEENQRYIDFIKSMSVTENLEELRSAMTVSTCKQPVPFLFDTPCLHYKLKKELALPPKEVKKKAKMAIQAIILGHPVASHPKK